MDELTEFCEANGLPPTLGETWRRRGIEGWTALQAAAWEQGLHRSGEHWLVAGPTSAGKGLVAEICAARHLLRGEKVLWPAPTRALAEMFHTRLRATFGPLGLRVACATHDRAEAGEEATIFRNQFDLLVAVYEKAAGWLGRQPHGLAEVGLVVADELPMLRDPERGARLDLLLTLIKTSPYGPRRIGLSLPDRNLDELARWWGGELLVCRERPRALREGVLDLMSGRFQWRNRLQGEEEAEQLASPEQVREWIEQVCAVLEDADCPPIGAATGAVAAGLASRGEATLLFAASRPQARRWAAGLAQAFDLASAPAPTLVQARRLAQLEPGHDHELLAETLARGVGFHHADLSAEARALVEAAFAAGEIALLIATPTLAQGVNLVAANVIHWPERNEALASGWRAAPLERWRHMDQGGRAARLGLGQGLGRSILIAWDGLHGERLRQRYLVEDCEALESGLAEADLASHVMLCLAGDVGRTERNLRGLFEATFAGQTAWRLAPEELEAKLQAALEACRAAHLLKEALPGERLRLTGLGQVCAAQGLPPGLVVRLRPWLEGDFDPGASELAEDPLAAVLPAIWALALCAPAETWTSGGRPGGAATLGMIREWFAAREQALPGPLGTILNHPGGLEAWQVAALEAGWRLAAWVSAEPTPQVEARTGWTSGMLARTGESLAWVARGAAAVGLMGGCCLKRAEAWRTLGTRLAAGVTAEGVALARLRLAGLGRTAIQALCADGLCSAEAIAGAPLELLEARVGDATLAERLVARARQTGRSVRGPLLKPYVWHKKAMCEATPPAQPNAECGVRSAGMPPAHPTRLEDERRLLEIDLQSPGLHPAREGRLLEIDLQSPGLVWAGGREVQLAPTCFDLLAALAEQPGKVMTRGAIYHRLWPEGGPEDQQLDAHRRRLTRELREVFGEQAEAFVQVVRGIGFRLNLAECEVHLRRG